MGRGKGEGVTGVLQNLAWSVLITVRAATRCDPGVRPSGYSSLVLECSRSREGVGGGNRRDRSSPGKGVR